MKNYEDYNKTKISGQNRLLHVSMKGEKEIRYFFVYTVKMINRSTMNFICQHYNRKGDPCKATLTAKVKFDIEEKVSEVEKPENEDKKMANQSQSYRRRN